MNKLPCKNQSLPTSLLQVRHRGYGANTRSDPMLDRRLCGLTLPIIGSVHSLPHPHGFKISWAAFIPLNDIQVKMVMDTFKHSKTHKPHPTPHAPIATIKAVVAKVEDMPNDWVVAFTILIMYYAGARQSKVMSRSVNASVHTHHITRANVTITRGTLKIEQK